MIVLTFADLSNMRNIEYFIAKSKWLFFNVGLEAISFIYN